MGSLKRPSSLGVGFGPLFFGIVQLQGVLRPDKESHLGAYTVQETSNT